MLLERNLYLFSQSDIKISWNPAFWNFADATRKNSTKRCTLQSNKKPRKWDFTHATKILNYQKVPLNSPTAPKVSEIPPLKNNLSVWQHCLLPLTTVHIFKYSRNICKQFWEFHNYLIVVCKCESEAERCYNFIYSSNYFSFVIDIF